MNVMVGEAYLNSEDGEVLYVTEVSKEYVHTTVIAMTGGNIRSQLGTKRLFTHLTFQEYKLKYLNSSRQFGSEKELIDSIHELRKQLGA